MQAEPRRATGGDDHEGPEEMSGALKNVAGNGGGDNAGKVAGETLKTGPAAGGPRSCKSLGDGPSVRGGDAEKDIPRMMATAENVGPPKTAEADTKGRSGEATRSDRFASERLRGARENPAIGKPTC